MSGALLGWSRLEELAEQQWGLFTAAQAREAGFAPYQLARAVSREHLTRVHHGVYEVTGSDQWSSFGDWAAQWLALRPDVDIVERRARPDSVVSHTAAAHLQQLGVITAPAIELTSPQRINVRNPSVRIWRGDVGISGRDWHLVEGFPVTCPLRTVRDLLAIGADGGHVGSAITMGLADGRLHYGDVLAACSYAARRWGHRPGDGAALLESLIASTTPPALVS